MSGGTRSYEAASRLVDRGHKVVMITTDRKDRNISSGWRITHENGIEVHWFSLPYSNSMGFYARIKTFLAFAIAASRRASSIRADVIFATSTPLTIAIPGLWAKWRHKIPMVFEVRDLWPEVPIAIGAINNPMLIFVARKLEKIAYHGSEAVVALSPGMKEGVVRAFYPKERVCVIPNACDNRLFSNSTDNALEFRNDRDWLQERPLLLYAGTLGQINGVGYFVDIAKELLEIGSPVRILVIGKGKEKNKIFHKALELGVLNRNFFMEDYLPKSQIPALFSAADISASLAIDLVEVQANSANKFFDTLAAKKPVMINYGGWQADIINRSGAGLVTWQKSYREAAQMIDKHIRDEKWLKSASQASGKLAQQLFDRDKLVNELEEVLLLASKGEGQKVSAVNGWNNGQTPTLRVS